MYKRQCIHGIPEEEDPEYISLAAKLAGEVKSKNPGFEPRIKKKDLLSHVFIMPLRNNRRIINDVYKRQAVLRSLWILLPYKTNSSPFYLHRHTSWISAAVPEEIRNISWITNIIQMPLMVPKNYAESHLNTQESL